ncbi:Molecular chaperone, DnaJ family protein, partial [Giardia duodenalis]
VVPFTSWAQCNEPDQEKDNDNRYVCVNGCGLDSTGKCVPTSNCPSQNTGCSSCDVDDGCLSCLNAPTAFSRISDCAPRAAGQVESFAPFCTCMRGYSLKNDDCTPQARKAGSTTAIVTVLALWSLLLCAGLSCGDSRDRRGSRQ